MVGQIVTKVPVRLLNDLPELSLRAGDVGVVRSSWHYPTVAYEVEFTHAGPHARVLLLDGQVEAAEIRRSRRTRPPIEGADPLSAFALGLAARP